MVNVPLTVVNEALTMVNVPLTMVNVPLTVVNAPLTMVNVALTVVNVPGRGTSRKGSGGRKGWVVQIFPLGWGAEDRRRRDETARSPPSTSLILAAEADQWRAPFPFLPLDSKTSPWRRSWTTCSRFGTTSPLAPTKYRFPIGTRESSTTAWPPIEPIPGPPGHGKKSVSGSRKRSEAGRAAETSSPLGGGGLEQGSSHTRVETLGWPPLSLRDGPAPKGRQNRAWGVSPRLEATTIPSPEGAADGLRGAGGKREGCSRPGA